MNSTPQTIWNSKQSHPELVVMDAKVEFDLTDEQCDRLRMILMDRGISKWLLARVQIIRLKHEMKPVIKNGLRDVTWKDYLHVYQRLQEIAKGPRWVEWGTHVHKKLKRSVKDIVVKGKRC